VLEEIDQTYVLAVMVGVAAFGATWELAQMTPKQKPRLAWEKKRPGVKGAIFSVIIVILIFGGIWLAQLLEPVLPGSP
jgi:hypothetical protein